MEAKANPQGDQPTLVKAKRQQVKVVFNRNVTADQIHKSLDRIFKEGGCVTCGLGGIDIRFIPEEIFQLERPSTILRELEGIKQVTVTQY